MMNQIFGEYIFPSSHFNVDEVNLFLDNYKPLTQIHTNRTGRGDSFNHCVTDYYYLNNLLYQDLSKTKEILH